MAGEELAAAQATTDLSLTPIWSMPIYRTTHPDAERLNGLLAETAATMMADQGSFAEPREWTNKFGPLFESRFDLFNNTELPGVGELSRFVDAALRSAAAHTNDRYGVPADVSGPIRIESWIHVHHGDAPSRHAAHFHPNATWSGIYYVATGDSGGGGVVRFYNPHRVMHLDFGLGAYLASDAWNHHDVVPVAGDLVLFPSHLQHEVFPYQGEAWRIAVAFNAESLA